MGILDDSVLETSYLPGIKSPDNIRKTYLFDHPASHVETSTPQTWMEHGRIVANIAKLIGDPMVYKILMLLTLTKLPHGAFQHRLEKLHGSYLRILQRRQNWICSKLSESGGLNIPPPNEIETISRHRFYESPFRPKKSRTCILSLNLGKNIILK
jgi:hypothetical protein